jgi:hypothetical protein
MSKKSNFIESAVVRQNVLNNTFAVAAIQKELGLTGILFENANQLETDLKGLGFLFADTVEEADKLNSCNEKA